jgi:hypothetical protein
MFFGAVLVIAGLVDTSLGGFAATAWQKRDYAGHAWTLGLSVPVAVPLAFVAFTASLTFLALAMFFLFLSTEPVNTLILETAPVNLRASAMIVLILPVALIVAAALRLALALKAKYGPHRHSAPA